MPTVTVDSAKRALLDHLIDDAGLFPPAALSMRDALRHHARHAESAYAYVDGAFVVPASRLGELADRRDPSRALTLSIILDAAALGAKGDVVRADLQRLTHAALDGVTVTSVELRTPSPLDTAGLSRAIAAVAEHFPGQTIAFYYESAYNAGWPVPPAVTFAMLAEAKAAAPAGVTVGAKLRCGGQTPGAIPSVDDVAAFIVAAQEHGIAWKATAGLHHPVRGVYAGEMQHGFLNLFIAAATLHAGALDAARVAAVLAEEDPRALVVDPLHVAWRDVTIDAAAVAAARAHAVSFGSCSFDEPVNGLRDLGILL
jgi:hypothetical protein